MAELDPSIILAGKSPVYEPFEVAQMRTAQVAQARQALAAGALENQQRQQALETGAEGLQADKYKNQATALQLADQATMSQQLHAMGSGVAAPGPAPAAVVAPPAAPSYARLPDGLIDRTAAPGQFSGPLAGLSGQAATGGYVPDPAVATAPAAGATAAAPAPVAGSKPAFDYDDYLNRIRPLVSPGAYFSAAQMVLGNKEKLAALDKTRGEVAEGNAKLETGRNNYLSSVARNIQNADYSPGSLELGLHMAESMGGPDGPEMARHVALIRQAIAQNPDNAKTIIDTVAAGGDAPTITAQSRATTAATGAAKQAAELPTQQAAAEQATRQNAAVNIASAPDLATAHRIAFKLPVDQQAPFLAALEKPDWQTAVTRVGLTPDQAVTTSAAQARDANTVANDAAMRQQGNARIGIEAQGLSIRRAEADPYGQLGINPHPIAAPVDATGQQLTGDAFLKSLPPGLAGSVKAIAEGRQTNLPRGKELGPLMNAVNQYDPSYSAVRGKARAAFTVGKQGQNVQALNTATVHLDQLADAATALGNGTLRPGNQLFNTVKAAFGQEAVTNFDALKTAVAGEMATALKGSATDQEITHITNTLQSANSPKQLAGVTRTNLHVLGAKLNTYDEQYHATVGKDDPWSPVLPAAKAVFEKNGIRPLASQPAATPKKNPYR